MDKNYNVDDILLDIKSKKLRRKEGGEPSRPALQEDKFPGGKGNGTNGVAFAPDPPASADSLMDEVLRELRSNEPGKPVKAPHKPFPTKEQAAKPARPEEPALRPEDSQATTYFQPVKKGAEPRSIEDLKRESADANRNPLNFDGYTRSIADRAQSRRDRNSQTRRQSQDDTAVIDFAKFRPVGGPVQAELDSELGETRVLPRLGASRELDLDEIRNIDFGALDDHDYVDAEDHYDDDDEYDYGEDELHRPAVDFSEYNSVEDRRDVAIDIARTKLWLVIRTLTTLLLTGLLIYLVLCGRHLWPMPEMLAPENDIKAYLLSLTALTVAVALAGSSSMGGGLISFFKMRSNSDSLAALAMLGAVGQCVFAVLNPQLADPSTLTFYCGLAALSMLFNALGKLSMISRIQANFKIISSDKPKKAVILADDEGFTREYLKGATRRPSIAMVAKCDFFTDFLALSYSDKYDVGINKAVAPVCLLGALVVGVLTYILTQGDSMTAVTALTGILCVASTFSATFIENVPLGKLTRKLALRGGMVSGNKAVEDFCDVSAIVMDEKDLFPAGCVEVHGIKAYSQGRVDEAILDAASLTYAMSSSVSGVFLQMIGGNKKLLRKVDNAAFENGRGIIAWIDGRRVLMGNRKLMQAHGITLPEPGFEKKYADEQGEPVFLASAGELSAQFVVGYRVDEELALELDRLGSMEKLLIVRTVDANLTPHKIWELYGYPEELVRIMSADQHEQYARMTAPRSSELAEIAYTGKASAMVGSILACVSARSSILAATMVQLIQIALGYGLISLLAFLGSMGTLTVPVLGAYQLFWFIVIWLIQRLRAA